MPDYEMYRDASFVLEEQIKNGDGSLVVGGIGGFTIWFTAKTALAQPDNVAAVRLDNGMIGGIAIYDANAGKVRVTIPPLATRGLGDAPVKLFWDLKVKDSLGNVARVTGGTLTVLPSVTRAT